MMRYASDTMTIPTPIETATTVAARPGGLRSATCPLPFPTGGPGVVPGARVNRGAMDPVALIHGIVRDIPGVFALTARGHSMRDALVNDGDVVLLQRDVNIKSGELAAVRLNGHHDVVLRRLYFEGDQVRLQPENRRLFPVVVDRRRVTIQGRVLAIARQNPLDHPARSTTGDAPPAPDE